VISYNGIQISGGVIEAVMNPVLRHKAVVQLPNSIPSNLPFVQRVFGFPLEQLSKSGSGATNACLSEILKSSVRSSELLMLGTIGGRGHAHSSTECGGET
jgi:hypothetical protein